MPPLRDFFFNTSFFSLSAFILSKSFDGDSSLGFWATSFPLKCLFQNTLPQGFTLLQVVNNGFFQIYRNRSGVFPFIK